MTRIETDLKNLIDTTSWSVPVEGVTKTTYIWVESLSEVNPINKPDVSDTVVVFVIRPSTNSQIMKTRGLDRRQYIGDLKLYADSIEDLESAVDGIITIANGEDDLDIFPGGLNGNPIEGYYNMNIIYRFNRFEFT